MNVVNLEDYRRRREACATAAEPDLESRAVILCARKSSTSLLAGDLGAFSTVASAAFKYGGPINSASTGGLPLTGTGGLY